MNFYRLREKYEKILSWRVLKYTFCSMTYGSAEKKRIFLKKAVDNEGVNRLYRDFAAMARVTAGVKFSGSVVSVSYN